MQDVSGFMVGPDAEQAGIIRAGARWVEAMATARVAKNRADRESRVWRGILCDGRAGLRSRFHLHLADRPDGCDGGRVSGTGGARPALTEARAAQRAPAPDVVAAAEGMRMEYETQLDARYAAARGFVDADHLS